MDNAEIDYLIKLRDGLAMASEAVNEYLDSLAPKEVKAAVLEDTFNILRFEAQEGAKIGSFELATEKNNLPDKWTHAYNVLRNSNATIQNRYHGEAYAHGYWLYGEGRIFRQKLKR